MKILLLLCAVFVAPISALAEGAVTRSEGFVQIWDSIKRPAEDTSETPFADVSEDHEAYKVLTYAKRRGILNDTASFAPSNPLQKRFALLWLYRTRNVSSVDQMTLENLPLMNEWYPLFSPEEDLAKPVSAAELEALMSKLDSLLNQEEHLVSFYGEDFQGSGTAFGEKFDMFAFTAAHRTFPHNTLVKVTNLENDKTVIVRINDRGPFIKDRDLDLSRAAFESISDPSRGVITARFERLGDESLVNVDASNNTSSSSSSSESSSNSSVATSVEGDASGTIKDCVQGKKRYQKRITRETRFHRGVPHFISLGESLTLASTDFFVIRSITHPDLSKKNVQLWIDPEEIYTFTPEKAGRYKLYIGNGFQRAREMWMTVKSC